MHSRRGAAALAAIAFAYACSESTPARGPGVHRSASGDTTVVFTVGDGVWGPQRSAVEVLRVAETSKETTFGQIQMIAAAPDGGVLVHDVKGADGEVVRQFGADGKFLRNIGRAGRGPGEYSMTMVAMAVAPNGNILLRVPFIGVKRFARDGRFLSEFATERRSGSHEIVLTRDTSIYLRSSLRGWSALGVAPMLRYDTVGRLLDSLVAGQWLITDRPPSMGRTISPRQYWTVAPNGRMVVTRTDKIGFLVVDPRAQTPPLIGEVEAVQIPITADERAEMERIEKWSEENCGLIEGGKVVVEGPKAERVPNTKPLTKGFDVDIDGRVWLLKSTPSVRGEERTVMSCDGRSTTGTFRDERGRVFAAFQLDGTYLGEIRFPDNAGRVVFVGEFAWAVVPNEDGVQQLIKYRLRD